MSVTPLGDFNNALIKIIDDQRNNLSLLEFSINDIVPSSNPIFPEASGSKSVSYTEEIIYPTRTGSSLSSNGIIAQTQIKYAKALYKHPNGNQYTKVSANNHVGGGQWGSYVGGNGAEYDSVSGAEYSPGYETNIIQTSSYTFSGAVSFTLYGIGVTLNNTTLSSSQNKWNFKFKSGYDFVKYKIYNKGTKNNLTAR